MSVFNSCLIVLEPLTHKTASLNKFEDEVFLSAKQMNYDRCYTSFASSRITSARAPVQ